ncbi:MAG: hypothetical protein JXB47_15570 [Anaerolineae bacterium]|nr:hypothetical protein [Anaerolineae bacterium]
MEEPKRPQPDETDPVQEGQDFIAEVHAKMSRVVDEFAQGKLNRKQFHQLYERYQKRIMAVAALLNDDRSGSWRQALDLNEDTLLILKKLTAKALGMAIYDNKGGVPIETLGNFQLEPALVVPMLSSYRSAAEEMFRAGIRSSAMDNGQWLCFVPGRFTTLIVLMSLEPSQDQLNNLERMHRDFERANKKALEAGNADPDELAYPFLAFVKRSRHR